MKKRISNLFEKSTAIRDFIIDMMLTLIFSAIALAGGGVLYLIMLWVIKIWK